jgi:hypothetical protein
MANEARPVRPLKDAVSHHRSALFSLAQSRLKHRPWSVLLKRAIWQWAYEYLRTLFLPRRDFLTYSDGSPRPGVFEIGSRCKIAIASDWGSGTDAAYKVAEQIKSAKPDYTVHMGDVYFSGTAEEFREYFFTPGAWPWQEGKTFLLNANHEMYSGGQGYFGLALPTVGQMASYFCLENENWRILGLDTGYYARVFPLLEFLLKGWIRLHDAIKEWLAKVVFSSQGDRGTIVLTHHQWFSAFDTEYATIGEDLSPYLEHVTVWFWGHEHRFAGYAPFGLNGKRVRARCIGHGGMPIELGEKKKRERPLVFLDERLCTTMENQKLGYCGFVLLDLDGPSLKAEYRDHQGTLLLTEEWTRPNPAPRVTPTAHLTLMPGQSWSSL